MNSWPETVRGGADAPAGERTATQEPGEGLHAAGGGRLADLTTASGSYTPLSTTVRSANYGVIPSAVDQVCRLTWFCEKGDIHARSSGYALEGSLINWMLLHPAS